VDWPAHNPRAQPCIGNQGRRQEEIKVSLPKSPIYVQKQIHQRQSAGAGDDLIAGEGFCV
jgi:hypothetical protein